MKTGLILIDVEKYMTTVSLVESGKLKEFYVSSRDSAYITGDIYKGQVVNVLSGLQSAFINFGNPKNGFLSVGETIGHKSVLDDAGVMPKALDVKPGDFVMVQATKEEIGTKGARLSTTISIPGRYLIFLPNLDFVGVSNKITDPEIREKFIKRLTKFKPSDGGFIARTACLEAKASEIDDEAKRLKKRWEKIKADYEETKDIAKVYSDGDLIFRSVRDMLSSNIDAVIVNDEEVANNLKEWFKEQNIPFDDRVRLYQGADDMYDAFNILEEVDKLLDRKVKLPSGVSLVFDYTEALTVIDVNTSRFQRGANHEETVFQANLEAAREIARQIRLRNIGGIIVIDFIDMSSDEHKDLLVEELKKELIFDRTKTRVIGMSSIGLVEITRKKVGKELSTVLLEECPYCKGGAHAHSAQYVARKIKAKLKRLFSDDKMKTAIITLGAGLVDVMFKHAFFSRECENEWKDKRIYLVPNPIALNREFTISGSEDSAVYVPSTARLLY